MLHSGDFLRFTDNDIQLFREVGIDVTSVRSKQDFEAVVKCWAEALVATNPSFLEKFARELVKTTGVKLPPELAAIMLPTGK